VIDRRSARRERGPGLRALSSFAFGALLCAGPRSGRAQEIGAPCTCTRELRAIEVPVVDASGRPVTTWRATVRRARDGKLLRESSSAEAPTAAPGPTPATSDAIDAGAVPHRVAALIADDAMLPDLRGEADTLVVDVRAGERRGRARVAVGFTGTRTCPCHVRLVRGPERIVVR